MREGAEVAVGYVRAYGSLGVPPATAPSSGGVTSKPVDVLHLESMVSPNHVNVDAQQGGERMLPRLERDSRGLIFTTATVSHLATIPPIYCQSVCKVTRDERERGLRE